MNAMEHGNRYDPEVPVKIRLLSSEADLLVRITNQGGSPVRNPDKEVPDLEAKLAGTQARRGWGLFLIRNMVDDVRVSGSPDHHTIELVMHLQRGEDASSKHLEVRGDQYPSVVRSSHRVRDHWL